MATCTKATIRRRQVKAQRMKLLLRRRELMERMARSDRLPSEREIAADVADQAEQTSTEEMSLRIEGLRAHEMQKIEDALHRMSEGRYGTCEWCNHAIPAARLELVPGATLCVACQKEFERESFEHGEADLSWEPSVAIPADESAAQSISGSRL